MIQIYVNRIWAKDYNYNSTAKAYLKLKDSITQLMCENVKNGLHTKKEFS